MPVKNTPDPLGTVSRRMSSESTSSTSNEYISWIHSRPSRSRIS